MTGFFYNWIWRVLGPFIWIYMAMRANAGKEDPARLSERYGRDYRNTRPEGKLIWLHGVSVGECTAALALARSLQAEDSDIRFLITTNTITAAAHVLKAAPELGLFHAYQPLDHCKWVDRFLDHWRPDAAIFLESDFWPNLIRRTAQRGIPVYFASSQLSESAYQKWHARGAFAQQVFGSARKIFAVDDAQAAHFATLSGHPDRLSVGGALKLDLRQLEPDQAFLSALLDWKRDAGQIILLLASSHEGEEAQLLDVLQTMPAETRPLIIIAPRHPQRGAQLAQKFGVQKCRSQSQLPASTDTLYLADTLGEMGSLFAAADIVLLGGSFVPLGGHNPLEPASFSKPLLSGPSQFKNQAVFDQLIEARALKILADMSQLPHALAAWQDAGSRQEAGNAGQKIATHASHAASRVAAALIADWRPR